MAPTGGAEAMVADFKSRVFPDREVRFITLRDGKKEVKVA